MQRTITDDLELLLSALPPHISAPLRSRDDSYELLEIVMDLGRLPTARYPGREVILGNVEVTEADLDFVVTHIGEFGDDNRAGIERTLHRISAIRNRRGRVVGLTCRVGRAIFGTIQLIEDLVQSGKSILLLGKPGVGKTTMLRETARVLADDLNKRVIIVDTSNEIAGDGDIPHPAIGGARRMQVRTPSAQHATMIEAVENHMPEVIVIDEIGTELEAAAARTIAERGVQLVGTAHGTTLGNLMMNPTLSDLIGGIQSVTLGDEEARRRGTQKSILERKAPPTFDIIVEIQGWDRVALHDDVGETVDAQLRGLPAPAEVREMRPDGTIETIIEERGENSDLHLFDGRGLDRGGYGERPERRGVRRQPAVGRQGQPAAASPRTLPDIFSGPHDTYFNPGSDRAGDRAGDGAGSPQGVKRIFPFGISRSRLEEAIREARVSARVVDSLDDADTVFTLNSYFRRRPPALRDAEERNIPLSVLKSNAVSQIEKMLVSVAQPPVSVRRKQDPELEALQEAEDAINDIRNHGENVVELPPQPSYIRRKQHELAQRFNLASSSRGREPHRGVRIFREGRRD
jgi:stage III sporulation protein SpoIIIAA